MSEPSTQQTGGGDGPSGPRASFGRRLVAILVDAVILSVIGFVVGMILGNLDRDISAYRALYDAGIIEAAAIITVAQAEMKEWAQEVTPGTTKFATSTTTNIDKAVPRLRRGDGGGCPIVVVGIGRNTV